MTTNTESTASAAPGAGERDFFAPLGTAEFIARYWCREPVYIAGARDKFAGLYSVDALAASMAGEMSLRGPRRRSLRAKVVRRSPDRPLSELQDVPIEHLMGLFDAGYTICVEGVEANHEGLAALLDGLCGALAFHGDREVNCYYSPGDQGFPWHFDPQQNIVVQIEGEKTWTYTRRRGADWPPISVSQRMVSNPAAQEATAAAGVAVVLPGDLEQVETTLRPGDVLYLPPGTWHGASALGHSLALTFTLHPINFVRAVSDFLALQAVRHVAWREDLSGMGDLAHEPTGEALRAFLDERLLELRSILAEMGPEELLRVGGLIRDSALLGRLTRNVAHP